MDVLILTGGLGSRLKEVVSDRPKTMAQIGGRPFLDMLIEHLSGFGFRRFILCVGYMADFITKYYNDRKPGGPEIVFSTEATPLGTGGAVKQAADIIGSDTFLVVNGDSFCPVDFQRFIEFHTRKQSLLSMALSASDDPEDYGTVVIDEAGRIIDFSEKRPGGKAWINGGVYLFERTVLTLIESGSVCSLEYDLFAKLVGKDFFGFLASGKVRDIGTPSRLEEAKRSMRMQAPPDRI